MMRLLKRLLSEACKGSYETFIKGIGGTVRWKLQLH